MCKFLQIIPKVNKTDQEHTVRYIIFISEENR